MPTWDAKQYLRFNDQRTRPCRELVARIGAEAPGRVIDLGCGPGNSTAVLAERWPKCELTGLDSSPDMIAAARKSYPQINWQTGDIAAWAEKNSGTYDIVFSNAAMQWVDNHAALFPKLLSHVAAASAGRSDAGQLRCPGAHHHEGNGGVPGMARAFSGGRHPGMACA